MGGGGLDDSLDEVPGSLGRLKAGLGFKQAKQTVVDSFEIAYLQALMIRNDGNITRSAQEAGLTRYHLRELLKRHGLKGGDVE